MPAHLSHEKSWSLSPLRDIQIRVGQLLDSFTIKGDCSYRFVVYPSRCTHSGYRCCFCDWIYSAHWFRRSRVIIVDQSRNFSDSIEAEISMPVGTPFFRTLAEAQRIAKAAELTDEQLEGDSIKSISVIVGVPIQSTRALGQRNLHTSDSSHIASVRVHLNDRPPREYSVPEFERTWRDHISSVAPIERLEFRSSKYRPLPNVAYSLRHEDREVLKSAASDLRGMLQNEPGLYGLTDNMGLGKRHIQFELTSEGLLAGITPASLGAQLRASFHGLEVQRIQRDHEEIKVILRYPPGRTREFECAFEFKDSSIVW